MDVSVRTAPTPTAQSLRDRRRRWMLGLGALLLLIALAVLAWWLLYARFYESTDDAYVAGDLVNVMSQLSGTVVSIGADETDLVAAGQELVRLDATDARIALQDAEQQLARTVRQTRGVFATRDQLQAVVEERRADLARAQADFSRRRNLAASGAVSGEELGHAQDALKAARDALVAAEKNLAASRALVGHTGVADNPDVRAAATQVERAWLALVRTSVKAPVSGYIAQRGVQLGERISPGAPLMSIVPLARLWIEANFREVQLRRMRIGRAGDGLCRPVWGPGHLQRAGGGPWHGHRLGIRAAARAERHRKLDQGGAARAGAHRARAGRVGGSSAARRALDRGHDRGARHLRGAACADSAAAAGAGDERLRHRSRRDPRAHRADHRRQHCRAQWAIQLNPGRRGSWLGSSCRPSDPARFRKRSHNEQ
jgi:multidrug resistance efflux pump